ncbi:MAG TPA: MBL fold metallo-hydrolase [Puia sp.]|nr:MBL fold metallo-hydrolase [Puia sp.]
MALPKSFGKNPQGADLEKIRKSSLYHQKGFENMTETRMLSDDASYTKMIRDFLFSKPKNTVPANKVPVVVTDLKKLSQLSSQNPVLIWFGHSSYLIYLQGLHILVDPVFSGHASPFSFTTKSFPGSNPYTADDLPEIDLLILTHDHYDHLDFETVMKLNNKTKLVCTSLGVGSHLRFWGWDEKKIIEFEWGDRKSFENGLSLTCATARHFSGRTFTRNKTLWSSFILETVPYKFYIGGDSGYDVHFKQIGEAYGPFDLVMLESGQYNPAWPNIHMMPEETVKAAVDLKAKILLPVHWGKFSLALHPWNEPIQRILVAARTLHQPVTTPMIGEPVILNEVYPHQNWWKED